MMEGWRDAPMRTVTVGMTIEEGQGWHARNHHRLPGLFAMCDAYPCREWSTELRSRVPDYSVFGVRRDTGVGA